MKLEQIETYKKADEKTKKEMREAKKRITLRKIVSIIVASLYIGRVISAFVSKGG